MITYSFLPTAMLVRRPLPRSFSLMSLPPHVFDLRSDMLSLTAYKSNRSYHFEDYVWSRIPFHRWFHFALRIPLNTIISGPIAKWTYASAPQNGGKSYVPNGIDASSARRTPINEDGMLCIALDIWSILEIFYLITSIYEWSHKYHHAFLGWYLVGIGIQLLVECW